MCSFKRSVFLEKSRAITDTRAWGAIAWDVGSRTRHGRPPAIGGRADHDGKA